MPASAPCILSPQGKQPFFGFLPMSAELKHYAVTGFEIPSLPALDEEGSGRDKLLSEILYRFQVYLLELHDTKQHRSVALQLMAHPELSDLVSLVRVYVLCRSAHDTAEGARKDVEAFVQQASQSFPQGDVFKYGQPAWLDQQDLEKAYFQEKLAQVQNILELRKYEEIQEQQGFDVQELCYTPHRLWADQSRDSLVHLIENLAHSRVPAAIRIELMPAFLDKSLTTGASRVLSWFTTIDEDMNRKASQGDQVRTDGILTDEKIRSPLVAWARERPKYIQRGKHVYEQLLANADRLFGMRIILASQGPIPDALTGTARAALSAPKTGDEIGMLGWVRPSVIEPSDQEAALQNLQWMIQTSWGLTPQKPKIFKDVDIRSVVTAEEAVSLFHLPVFERTGQTSALSTVDCPFVIPPETLEKSRFQKGKPVKKVRVGHLYQRERLLDSGDELQPFWLSTSDLIKPSLLVGSPGSGKTNLAISLLIQLWKEGVPFLVLDPSTGQEFRTLLAEPSLKKELVLYTVGDKDTFPLQFNPFSVPPGVTVRNYTTQLLAAFRAAFQKDQFWDPLPAIFEGALERVYTDERFSGKGLAMAMDQKGDLESFAPTLADYEKAMDHEVSEVTRQYEGSGETIGNVRGASIVRIKAIRRKLGHILNVPGNGAPFFQKLLERPAVIELGSLGDSSSIALLMAFIIAQLSGHVEYAYRRMSLSGKKREHLILIEEAHRLLSGGNHGQGENKSAEDLNQMLAEVRKFGQGIMVLDQRPSSLVGGVLDNAYVKILTRLSDREGFDRLSDDLNMNEAQRRFARTRLKPGDAILLDREAGLPLLVRSDNVKDDLDRNALNEEVFRAQIEATAERYSLYPPEAQEEESFTTTQSTMEAPSAQETQRTGTGIESTAGGEVRQWLYDELHSIIDEYLNRDRDELVLAVRQKLAQQKPDFADIKRTVDTAFGSERSKFMDVALEISERIKWSVICELADRHGSPDTIKRANELRPSAKRGS